MSRLALVALAAALLLTALPAGADQAAVRAGLDEDAAPWTGQQVVVNLDLETDALSFANVFFNLPEVEGAFLMRPDTSTLKLTESREGETWQVLRYPLALFPLVDGEITVPPISVRFDTTRGFGSTSETHALNTEAFTITVRRPPGLADNSLVVTSPRLEITPTWTRPSEPVQAGDAWTLEVRRRANAVSAMLLPPLPVYETDGLAAYPEAPEVNDRANRGSLVGERVDRITWIVERAGAYRIPDIRFQWWDPAAERLEDLTVTGVTFDAAAAPGQTTAATPATAAGERGNVAAWLGTLLLALAAGVAAWRFRVTLRRWGRRILPPPRALLKDLNPGSAP